VDSYTCEQVAQRLQDYVDRELCESDRERVARHLEECAWCAREARFESTLLLEIRGRLSRIEAPPDLLRKVTAAIDGALDRPAGVRPGKV
jgi:anti-sigma factor (TIGR02949 family)